MPRRLKTRSAIRSILFLCTGNSCRSQMAEGFARLMADEHARHYGVEPLVILSAGIESHGKNPRAISIMADAGIDISAQESTTVTDDMLRATDLVVTVCGHADEHCPLLPAGTQREHWPLSDPAKATGSEDEITQVFRASRDEIRARVQELLGRLLDAQRADDRSTRA